MTTLDAAILRKFFRYEEETGCFYRYQQQVPSGRTASNGYIQIFFQGKRHMAHRLAWLYVHGTWPDSQIDHINQCRDDNRIANLRLATNQTQQENVASYSHNTTGFRGVTKHKSGKFQAQIGVNGKTVHLGLYATLEEAATARMAAEKQHFQMLENSPNYSRLTHGENVRVNNRAYSIEASGTKIVQIV